MHPISLNIELRLPFVVRYFLKRALVLYVTLCNIAEQIIIFQWITVQIFLTFVTQLYFLSIYLDISENYSKRIRIENPTMYMQKLI